jgi:cellulose synthase/poly-beta-1,6-N-acetylglucosamine synthase-like glycosyltransferase
MIYLFLRRQRKARSQIAKELDEFHSTVSAENLPYVTVQLPIYNELEVVERLILSSTQLDYPKNCYEVQVLDDSTDETRDLVDQVAKKAEAMGVNIQVFRRTHRTGFKAGALAEGMHVCKGEFIAIFDSDFVIPENFLKRSIALIAPYPQVACVQGRWGHLNREENWLTRSQSVGIDGHFTAEQGARSYSGLCMNFNGTAGVWRKEAIYAAGGWHADTLTEDLDLSYRVQLKGYKIRYDFDLECPAEIPNTITALKSQQKRWAQGSIETAKKLLPTLWKSKILSLNQKLEATLHLTHYMVSLFMTVLCILALPMLLWTPVPNVGWFMASILMFIVVSAIAPCVMYAGSGFILRRGMYSLVHFPAMLVMGTGLCLNNTWAVLEGIMGRKAEFIRTPKSGSTSSDKKLSKYKVNSSTLLGILETLLGLYCIATVLVYLSSYKYIFGFFIGAYAIGLTCFGLMTLKTKYWPSVPRSA